MTRAPKLKKQMGAIDWTKSAALVDCQIRAMQPWPNPFTYLHSPGRPPQRLLILAVRPAGEIAPPTPPGSLVIPDRERLLVQTGAGALEVLQIQPEGKRPMSAAAFLRGRKLGGDDCFGPEAPG